MTNLLENTLDGASVMVAPTDEKLNIQDVYSQLDIPSLGKEIFKVYKQNGPMAGIFSLDTDGTKFKLLRKNSQVFESTPINTGISTETIQDIESQFGLEANTIIAHLLRGLANTKENEKTSEFLSLNAEIKGPLGLSNARNSKIIVEEISQRVSESVVEMNADGFITYQASVVIPMKYAAAFMARSREDIDGSTSFYVGKTGLVKYYTDPDVTNTETVYVILKEESKSGGFFSEYTDDIIKAVDYDTGTENLFIFNRFAITANPKHSTKPMMHQFALTESAVDPGTGGGFTGTVIDVVGPVKADDTGAVLIKRDPTSVNPGLPLGFHVMIAADGVDVVLDFGTETILENGLSTLTIPAGYAVSITKIKSNVWMAYEMRLNLRVGL